MIICAISTAIWSFWTLFVHGPGFLRWKWGSVETKSYRSFSISIYLIILDPTDQWAHPVSFSPLAWLLPEFNSFSAIVINFWQERKSFLGFLVCGKIFRICRTCISYKDKSFLEDFCLSWKCFKIGFFSGIGSG